MGLSISVNTNGTLLSPALRLAKFNLDERQQTGLIGLPTPANALFWGALAQTLPTDAPNALLFWSLLGGALISCWLLVAEIPMFALKFKHFGWHATLLRSDDRNTLPPVPQAPGFPTHFPHLQ